jgi:hypothetical protein
MGHTSRLLSFEEIDNSYYSLVEANLSHGRSAPMRPYFEERVNLVNEEAFLI